MRQLKRTFVQIIGRLIPDKQWIQIMYFVHLHKRLDLKNPQTFNEKLQWLKLYYRRPDHTRMVDKYEMKKYVAEKLGEESVVPVLGVWNKAEDIDFNSLPDKFVLKVTHDSGGVVICKDKNKLNIEATRKKLKQALRNNYYIQYREWPYKNIIPRIMAEQLLEDKDRTSLIDYKIHCFNGEPQIILVCQGRFVDFREDFYSFDWKHLDVKRPNVKNADEVMPAPNNLDQMLNISRILSQGIPFVRVDLYIINQHIYVGEMTFFPNSGIVPFLPEDFDLELGYLIQLPGER